VNFKFDMNVILKSRIEMELTIFENIRKICQHKIDNFKINTKNLDSDCDVIWPVCIMNVEEVYRINTNNILKKEDSCIIEDNFLTYSERNRKKLSLNYQNNDIKIYRMKHQCMIVRTSIIEDNILNNENENTSIKSSEDSFTSNESESDREGKVFNKYISHIGHIRNLLFIKTL